MARKKFKTSLEFMVFGKIIEYVQLDPTYTPNRWEVANYLIGYYGAITADHMAAIADAVREGIVTE